MSAFQDLIAELDRIETLPAKDRPAEKLLVFRRVEAALRSLSHREGEFMTAVASFRPALYQLSRRLIQMERTVPSLPDVTLLRDYYGALARARIVVGQLESLAATLLEDTR